MTSSIARRAAFLEEMGIGPAWVRREDGAAMSSAEPVLDLPAADTAVAPRTVVMSAATAVPGNALVDSAPADSAIAEMDWNQLKVAVAACTRCGLCEGRTNAVFGVGDQRARWLFVGEGPGRNEDLQGEPFVGKAGQLLDNMLAAMGLKRGENAYIANIVKCRPTGDDGRDRPPTPEESAACMPYLERQIALIKPAVIVALGKTAALSMLGIDPATPVGKLRGTVHRYVDLPLIVTYHPAYLLRTPADKSKVWSDLCLAMSTHVSV